MKTFQAVFNEEEVDGVFGISLVHDPAMQGDFIALKKDSFRFAEVDKEQRILMGLVLEPNKPIYRNQNGEEFNIVFNEDTIKDLSYNFFKSNSHKTSTIEHEDNIQGVTFVESWIVKDSKNDKSNAFGFEYPEGTWMATMKVDSDEIWQDFVKTGKVKGFSIDAMLSLKEVNLKSNINMSELKEAFVSFKDDILEALNLKKEEAKEVVKIEMGSVKSADGQILFEYDGETPEVGGSVWVVTVDDTGEEMRVPIPVGEYELEGGAKLVVSEEGKIASMDTATQEVKPEVKEEMEAETTPNTGGQDANSVINQVQESIKSIMIKYKEDIDSRFDSLAKENEALKKEILELSEQPAAKQIKTKAVQVDLSSMTELEKRKYYRSNG